MKCSIDNDVFLRTDAIHSDEEWGNGESDDDVMATGRRTNDLGNLNLCTCFEHDQDE